MQSDKHVRKNLQIGDSKGNNPIFAEVRATAIVTSGAERAFPMTVLRSTTLDVRNAHKDSIADASWTYMIFQMSTTKG